MHRHRRARAIAAAGLALVITLAAPASAGFLGSTFGGDRQQERPAAAPSADVTASVTAPRERRSGSGAARDAKGAKGAKVTKGGARTFCVRLCDGRAFPLQRHAGATPVQICSALCPAATTRIFTGAEIAHASAADGGRYADLDNAFVYRKKIVDGCTCNGRDAFGLAPMDVANDPTLRPGDVVTTQSGLQTFTGAQAQPRKDGAAAAAGAAASQPPRIATTRATD